MGCRVERGYFAIRIKAGQAGVFPEYLLHGLHFFVGPVLQDQLAAHTTYEYGQFGAGLSCADEGIFGGSRRTVDQSVEAAFHQPDLAALREVAGETHRPVALIDAEYCSDQEAT
jgi:hypothetical protein